ncbi:MAG: hypothetical protein PHC66_03380 [Candidatus Nanoarchaeia archaeon]|nr:hypothetical protein [Candidatus Nanoarchaeia archaeon]MDD5239837.1 hypothetical protein [Candidatus Nanoarchaeia archaeon]
MVQSLYKEVEGIQTKPLTSPLGAVKKRINEFIGLFGDSVNFSEEDIRNISKNFRKQLRKYEQNYPRHGEFNIVYEHVSGIKTSPICRVRIYSSDRNVYVELDCWSPDHIKAELDYTSDNRNDKEEYEGLVKLLEMNFPEKPKEDDF